MYDLTEKQLRDFMDDLGELTKKHRIVIQGCGCCGSPYFLPLRDKDKNFKYRCEEDGAYLEWKEEKMIDT